MACKVLYDEGALQRIRKDKGLSPEQLAARAGISSRAIRYLEKGTAPLVTTLANLAAALDVDVAVFFTPRRLEGS